MKTPAESPQKRLGHKKGCGIRRAMWSQCERIQTAGGSVFCIGVNDKKTGHTGVFNLIGLTHGVSGPA